MLCTNQNNPMKQTTLIVFSGLMLISIHSYSQDVQKYNETYRSTSATVSKTSAEETRDYYVNYQNSLQGEFDGTYQFIITGNEKIIITSETLDFIQQNRDKKKETVVNLTENIKVKILPEHVIKSKKFVPVNELFVLELN